MNIIVVVVSRSINVKVANIGTVLWATVHQYLNIIGYTIGYSATLKLLKSMNFRAKIKVKKPLLKKTHRERRLAWAIAHKDWTNDDWRRMVFSDETKVNVFGSDGCKYYWSRPNDTLQPHHLDLTVKGGNGSVMVWGCITYDGPGYACWIHDHYGASRPAKISEFMTHI
ncbi:hypothetical protein G6F69_009534 [Rhizopus microsporus]|nr:hypothetical protein G6F69_009534 [Rhizopus microsporus]